MDMVKTTYKNNRKTQILQIIKTKGGNKKYE